MILDRLAAMCKPVNIKKEIIYTITSFLCPEQESNLHSVAETRF